MPTTQPSPTKTSVWRAPPAACAVLSAALALAPWPVWAGDTSAQQQLERFSQQAQTPGNAERGRVFFTTRHTGEWSCSSCHGTPPNKTGKHASTGKAIDPLAPKVNPMAFTDTAKVDKWFRRNCKDVVQRECGAGEKADVLAYLLGVQP